MRRQADGHATLHVSGSDGVTSNRILVDLEGRIRSLTALVNYYDLRALNLGATENVQVVKANPSPIDSGELAYFKALNPGRLSPDCKIPTIPLN